MYEGKEVIFEYYDKEDRTSRKNRGVVLHEIPLTLGFELVVLTEDGDVRGIGKEDLISVDGKNVKKEGP